MSLVEVKEHGKLIDAPPHDNYHKQASASSSAAAAKKKEPHRLSGVVPLQGFHPDASFNVRPDTNMLVFYRNMPPRMARVSPYGTAHSDNEEEDEEDNTETDDQLEALEVGQSRPAQHHHHHHHSASSSSRSMKSNHKKPLIPKDSYSMMAYADICAYNCCGCITGGVLEARLVYKNDGPDEEFRVLEIDPDVGVHTKAFSKWKFNPREWYYVSARLPEESHKQLLRFVDRQKDAQYNVMGNCLSMLGCFCCAMGVDSSAIAPERDMFYSTGFEPRDFNNRPSWGPRELLAGALVHIGLIPSTAIDVKSATYVQIRQQVENSFRRLIELERIHKHEKATHNSSSKVE